MNHKRMSRPVNGCSIDRSLVVVALLACACVLGSRGAPEDESDRSVSAFSMKSPTTTPPAFTDLSNSPLDTWRWEKATLTYQFTDSFEDHAGVAIKRQVRLALAQWASAFDGLMGTPDNYDYGAGIFGTSIVDVRSLVLHELGHVLGFHHPDEAGDLNFSFDGGVPSPAPLAPGSVMGSELTANGINRILSNDELEAFAFVYGQHSIDLEFSEVTDDTTIPDITFDYGALNTDTCPDVAEPSTKWGCARYDAAHDPADDAPGRIIDRATITLNANGSEPIGFRSLKLRWHLKSQGGMPSILQMRVQTWGTDNPRPLNHLDNPGPNPFATPITSGLGGADEKDILNHTWRSKFGTIPISVKLRLGLAQDAAEWCVYESELGHGNQATGVTAYSQPILLSAYAWRAVWTDHPVLDGGLATTPLCTVSTFAVPKPNPDGSVHGPTDRNVFLQDKAVLARGFLFSAAGAQRGTGRLVGLRIADVSGREPSLDQMSEDYFTDTQQLNDALVLSLIGASQPVPVALSRDLPFIVVLDGEASALPPEVVASNQFVIVPGHQDWAERPLLVQIDTELDTATPNGLETTELSTFAVINGSPEVARTRPLIYLPLAVRELRGQ